MSTKHMVQIPQALQSKLATAEESEPGVHLVDIHTRGAVYQDTQVVNRCVALLDPTHGVKSEDIIHIALK